MLAGLAPLLPGVFSADLKADRRHVLIPLEFLAKTTWIDQIASGLDAASIFCEVVKNLPQKSFDL